MIAGIGDEQPVAGVVVVNAVGRVQATGPRALGLRLEARLPEHDHRFRSLGETLGRDVPHEDPVVVTVGDEQTLVLLVEHGAANGRKAPRAYAPTHPAFEVGLAEDGNGVGAVLHPVRVNVEHEDAAVGLPGVDGAVPHEKPMVYVVVSEAEHDGAFATTREAR